MLSRDHLHQLFVYSAETGELVWRKRPLEHFNSERDYRSWNTLCAGKTAGSPNNWGHLKVRINNEFYQAHRIIWMMLYGDEPELIDHINGNPADNRIHNLRACTAVQNLRNRRVRSGGVSKVFGVRRVGKKWLAQIGDGGRLKTLGSFDNRHEAIAARRCAELTRGYSPDHGQAA